MAFSTRYRNTQNKILIRKTNTNTHIYNCIHHEAPQTKFKLINTHTHTHTHTHTNAHTHTYTYTNTHCVQLGEIDKTYAVKAKATAIGEKVLTFAQETDKSYKIREKVEHFTTWVLSY